MAKISVIVPVYNVEKYLEECLNSIICQTFSDIEIICVNDGSTDNSRTILEEYKRKDSRIIIIDKENGGLSSARNAGYKIAQGEFISYIDSDDWVESTMLEKLYNNITSLNSDIAICAVNQYDEWKGEMAKPTRYFSLAAFDKSFENRTFSYRETAPFIMEVCVMAWNKLYRKSFLDYCNAEFPEGLIFEDGPFFFSIFFKTDKVSIVREFLYYYRINRQGSIVQIGGEKFLNIIDVVNLMYIYLKATPIWKQVKYDFYRHKAEDVIYRYDLMPLKIKRKFSKKFRKESCLLKEKEFDFSLLNKEIPITYKSIRAIQHRAGILYYNYRRLVARIMYKIMQILYTEENIYYFKFWKHIFRIKKQADKCDVWYENDRIYVVILKKIKFDFKFEYSKLEKK